MNDIRAIGAVFVAIGVFIIGNYVFDRIERRAAKTQHRDRVRLYTDKRLRLMEGNAYGLLDKPKSIRIAYEAPNKHRNTYFHSEECAAACGGKYLPKGADL